MQALLFPGQGAQAVGMGRDLADEFEAAERTFEEANEALGFDVAALCFDGPLEQLSRSDVAQPAILATSVAALRSMEEAAGEPMDFGAAAGLSLGEYTALVAAGALDFQEAIRLVRHRGAFMQEACELTSGGMCSIIGMDDADVEAACRRVREQGGRVWPANYNSPGQLVISGEEGAVDEAAEICSDMGARRAIKLNVAGAFHTELMASAAEKLAPLLAEARFSTPTCAVVANVTGRPVGGPDEIRDLLVRQVTGAVRWSASMTWLAENGGRTFLEVGPGRVLQGLLRRTVRDVECSGVATAADVHSYAGAD